MAQKDNPMLTITLTGRAPVKINREEWPVLASATDEWNDDRSGTGTQANREKEYRLTVRQHADGRAVVYAVYDYDTNYQSEQGSMHRAGELLTTGANVIAAIQRIGEDMESRVGDGMFARLVHECIADLPAETI